MLLNLPEEEMTKMQNWDRGRFQEPIRFQEHLLGTLEKLNLPATVAHFGLLLNLPEEARRRKVRLSGTSSRKAGECTGDGRPHRAATESAGRGEQEDGPHSGDFAGSSTRDAAESVGKPWQISRTSIYHPRKAEKAAGDG
ncbi:uncharacterized protein LOC120415096 [Culex pipiens pallens]|uniref:uncharacterized protein LOC120415096 n=1 Tax=Culex pipiens pallens TaxID=42434 RepID=UPI0019540618|nr:uncharacterized protein LOC120415096 [Culex pipiens pallens]